MPSTGPITVCRNNSLFLLKDEPEKGKLCIVIGFATCAEFAAADKSTLPVLHPILFLK